MFVKRVGVRRIARSTSLVERSQGETVAAEIERQIAASAEPTILFVDFSGIRCSTLSCLRAILKAIGTRGGRVRPQCSVGLRFDAVSRDLTDSLNLLFRETGQTLLAVDEEENWEVLGPMTSSEGQTITILMDRGSVTSVELSSVLGIKLNAASTRLKKLYDQDLAARYESAGEPEGGRLFVYQRLHGDPGNPVSM